MLRSAGAGVEDECHHGHYQLNRAMCRDALEVVLRQVIGSKEGDSAQYQSSRSSVVGEAAARLAVMGGRSKGGRWGGRRGQGQETLREVVQDAEIGWLEARGRRDHTARKRV